MEEKTKTIFQCLQMAIWVSIRGKQTTGNGCVLRYVCHRRCYSINNLVSQLREKSQNRAVATIDIDEDDVADVTDAITSSAKSLTHVI
jgi:hypothetical protein